MKPIIPTPKLGAAVVVFGKDQVEYEPLPATVTVNGLMTTEWELSAEDRAILVNGGRIQVQLMMFNAQPPPMLVTAVPKRGDYDE